MKTQFQQRFSDVEREEIVDKSSRCLWTNSGKIGRDYLLNVRKLSEETLRKFRLGYLPVFVKHQLRGRIILPLFDASNHLIAVCSRAVEKKEKDFLPVYWHESYQKTFYLYGIQNTHKNIRKSKLCILVEGQIDCLQLYSSGILNVVALCGNKLSDVQISIIHRYCKKIVLLLDRDENQAGQEGTKRILDHSVVEVPMLLGTKLKFPIPSYHSAVTHSVCRRQIIPVSLSENSDPDEFVKKYGPDTLRAIIKDKIREFDNN